jgi:hypothetical protein
VFIGEKKRRKRNVKTLFSAFCHASSSSLLSKPILSLPPSLPPSSSSIHAIYAQKLPSFSFSLTPLLLPPSLPSIRRGGKLLLLLLLLLLVLSSSSSSSSSPFLGRGWEGGVAAGQGGGVGGGRSKEKGGRGGGRAGRRSNEEGEGGGRGEGGGGGGRGGVVGGGARQRELLLMGICEGKRRMRGCMRNENVFDFHLVRGSVADRLHRTLPPSLPTFSSSR